MIKWLLLALVLLLVLTILAAGWHFSNRILVVQPVGFTPQFTVLETAGDAVLLPRTERTSQPGLFGLAWEGGHGEISAILEEGEDSVRRRYRLLLGDEVRPGEGAQMDAYIYRSDPFLAHGLRFEDLTLAGEAGALKAWWLEGDNGAAVIMLHGRNTGRYECLRTLPAMLAGGFSALVLAYRNHDGSAPSPDGFHHYGASEWQDVLTAVHYLEERRGVNRIVLYGFSMGGAVALEAARALERERGPGLLAGIILDAPMLDVHAAIHQGAARMGLPLPGPLSRFALWVAGLRTGIRWADLDKRRTLGELSAPILLIHGDADTITPVWVSDEFAALAPQQIRYARAPGAGHVESWNQERESYEGWLRDFLSEVASAFPRIALP
jgi:uncharacterized protein